ncbi:MAG TPA: MFS transporter [Anaerolineales bacterium]|nr:MFS transporter [Anaerolineales bacterium]
MRKALTPARPNSARAYLPLRLGLLANWKQFVLLLLVNAFVGAMVGLERTVIPLIAEKDFGLVSRSVTLSFLIGFGVVKALANLFAGRMSDRLGRKSILVAGWLAGLPVPFLIILAPNWNWIVFANLLLGINQGLCWSTTVIMKIDLVGAKQRGLAMGLNEFAGYLAVSFSAFLTGYLAGSYGLRPIPFYPGIAFALLGLILSVFFVTETRPFARQEAQERLGTLDERSSPGLEAGRQPSFTQILLLTSWKDRALFAASQAGLVNNLNDGMVWGLVPILLTSAGLPLEQVGLVAAVYPGVWGLSQLATGALSDRLGRKWLIAAGMWVQAVGIGLFFAGRSFGPWLAAAVLLGLGTAMVYPTLLAAVSDIAQPDWRASAVGVYRLWRDGGYALGALLSGILADALGIPAAIAAIAALTAASGFVVAAVMYETIPTRRGIQPALEAEQLFVEDSRA